jgi:hypothetical protein
MRIETLLSTVIIPVVGLSLLSSPSHALDLNGAWATDAADCQKIFVKKGNAISFRPQSELHGGGFIIDGNTIRGKAAKCVIKARREDGEIIHLMAACATDIMLSNVQFSLRVVNENKVSRIFPGMEGMELAYDRCDANADGSATE